MNGFITPSDRQFMISKFNNSSDVSVLLASTPV